VTLDVIFDDASDAFSIIARLWEEPEKQDSADSTTMQTPMRRLIDSMADFGDFANSQLTPFRWAVQPAWATEEMKATRAAAGRLSGVGQSWKVRDADELVVLDVGGVRVDTATGLAVSSNGINPPETVVDMVVALPFVARSFATVVDMAYMLIKTSKGEAPTELIAPADWFHDDSQMLIKARADTWKAKIAELMEAVKAMDDQAALDRAIALVNERGWQVIEPTELEDGPIQLD
jgi:hypothetical protein